MKFENKPYYYITVFIIIIISFLFYSSNYYPRLNSDDALNILMAHYYKLPNDFYCWGQDRGGTLIPLISQIFIKVFQLSSLTSVSLSNYFILILGFIGFSSLFKTNYSKLLFGVIWFLPFQRFIDILRFPIGVEYSLIAFAIFLINKLENKDLFSKLKTNLLLSSIVVIFIIAVWVSDLAIITIGVLLFVLFIFELLKRRRFLIQNTYLVYFILGSISCFLFIWYAKTFAVVKTEHYLSVNNIDDIKLALQVIKTRFTEVLTFQTKEIIVSIYAYCVFLFLIVFCVYILKKKLLSILIQNKWVAFFIFDFVVVIATFLLSSWVLANGMGRWYFVASYISFSLVILLAVEIISSYYPVMFIKLTLLFVVLLGAISPVYTMKFTSPKTLKPMVKVVGEFKQLGEIGVISEFWNSYITSCPDPGMIKATPNDQSGIRNQGMVDSVFNRKNLYVIKDMWLDKFPDTLLQFGYVLLKDGELFRLGGCNVCKYNKIKLQKVFPLNRLKYNESQIIFDNVLKKNVLFVSSNCDTCREKFFIYGPYIPIGIGTFTVKFYIKACNFKSDNSFAMVDVSADWGTVALSSRKINISDFADKGYNCIDLDFKTFKRYNSIEFRIYYYGNADMYFDYLELKEK